ncbi:hypothetical protein [Asaia sp. VD9]|uniref:hypothetical protein n=1 Tax=Asaia sp. VD9 TaxID=3081235 RepID=UPI003019B44E
MKPEALLPRRVIALYDRSLLAYLPPPDEAPPYAVIPAPGLGPIMGLPWWLALTRDLHGPKLFDAGSAPALAALALREGVAWVICTARGPALETIRALAPLCGGQILTSRPDALTLGRPPYNAYRLTQLSRYLARES